MRRHRLILVVASVASVAILAGCGGSGTAPIAPSSRVQHLAGSSSSKIVLTAVGAQRIGIRTARVTGAGNGGVVIPYSAVVYDPSGATYAFIAAGRLAYTEVAIKVQRIDGRSALLAKGPPSGAQVVTVGAEELFGVQTGVLAQS